ncbi:hypothetical protein ABVK25_003670 [Lepraria finkii]|uniref:Uncharacterized protein n=1 Tax=Lepraria finkii TaxID=1340010 RepID=A0ABR4BEW4_9LECA
MLILNVGSDGDEVLLSSGSSYKLPCVGLQKKDKTQTGAINRDRTLSMIREVSQNRSTTSRANCSYSLPMQVSGIEFNCRSMAINKPVNGQPQAYLQLSPALATGNGNRLSPELPTLLQVASHHLDAMVPSR